MKELSELKPLFESLTIRPTFDYVHVILSLFIFGENPDGIGRYRLKDELQIGSGTAKSLVKKLKDVSGFIVVPDEGERRKGHILTEKGHKFFAKIKKKIPLLEKADLTFLKDIIIEPENVNPYFCLVKNATKKIKNGIEQRDAAIKVNGSGATCLVYDGKDIVFPSKFVNNSAEEQKKINQKTLKYFTSKIIKAKVIFEKDDVIIIGLGASPQISRLAALNAALTLF
jgi:predicted transcriptional regulator